MNFKDMNAVQIMKGYMANGTFGRGTDSYNAEASMVFEGNINDTVAQCPQDHPPVRPVPARVQQRLAPSSTASTATCPAGRCPR